MVVSRCLMGILKLSDGGEAEEEKEQDIAYQNRFTNSYESRHEQVSLQFLPHAI